MAHTYVSNLVHCVFGTKARRKQITPELQERLWPFIAGIARQNHFKAITIGGTHDHVHILLSIPATMSVAKAAQLLKGGSSKWVHETFPKWRDFAWQEGYGAFSISQSHLRATIDYIERQQEHHRTKTFEQEFLAFLKKHGIQYDRRYVLG